MGVLDQVSVKHFIDRYGHALEREGFPLIAGRMVSLFLVESGPFNLEALADLLQVSAGSASTNTRFLESLGMLERTSLPGDRRTYYRLADDPYDRWLLAELDRLRQRRSIVEQALAALAEFPASRHRLEEMAELQRRVIEHREEALAVWKAEHQRAGVS